MLEHAVDAVPEFAHNGDQGHHLGFDLGTQVLIEGAQVRLMANRHQSGHVEGAAQVSVADFADAALLVHRGALAGWRIHRGFGDVCDSIGLSQAPVLSHYTHPDRTHGRLRHVCATHEYFGLTPDPTLC